MGDARGYSDTATSIGRVSGGVLLRGSACDVAAWAAHPRLRRFVPVLIALPHLLKLALVCAATLSQTATVVSFASLALLLFLLAQRPVRSLQRTQVIWLYCDVALLALVMLAAFLAFREILLSELLVQLTLIYAALVLLQRARMSPGRTQKFLRASSSRALLEPSAKAKSSDADLLGYGMASQSCVVNGVGGAGDFCAKCSTARPPHAVHCALCNQCILYYDHHSVWVNQCVGDKNHRPYFLALLAYFCAVARALHLLMTVMCTPAIYWELLYFPEDCSQLYGDPMMAGAWVFCLYFSLVAAYTLYLLIKQSVCISLNITAYQMGQLGGQVLWVLRDTLHSGRLLANWVNFWRGARYRTLL